LDEILGGVAEQTCGGIEAYSASDDGTLISFKVD
jgi:hypothetical protein